MHAQVERGRVVGAVVARAGVVLAADLEAAVDGLEALAGEQLARVVLVQHLDLADLVGVHDRRARDERGRAHAAGGRQRRDLLGRHVDEEHRALVVAARERGHAAVLAAEHVVDRRPDLAEHPLAVEVGGRVVVVHGHQLAPDRAAVRRDRLDRDVALGRAELLDRLARGPLGADLVDRDLHAHVLVRAGQDVHAVHPQGDELRRQHAREQATQVFELDLGLEGLAFDVQDEVS